MALALPRPAVSAVTKMVRAAGLAAIVDGDRTRAFREARGAALREAVEEGVGVLVSSATQVRNYEVIADDILTRTAGYVRQFSIVEQGDTEGEMYRVVIDAVVDLEGLHRDLGALRLAIVGAGSPRLQCLGKVLVVRGQLEEEVDWGVLQASLAREVAERGSGAFQVVLPSSGPADSTGGAAGDILLMGEAHITSPAVTVPFTGTRLADTGLRAAVAAVVVRGLWADSRETVCTAAAVGRASDTVFRAAAEEAIRRAVGDLGKSLVDGLAEEMRRKAYAERVLQLEVHGSPSALSRLEEELPRRVGAIDELKPRSYGDNHAVYDMRVHSTAFEVARSLSAGALEGADLEILWVSANTLTLRLPMAAADSEGK
ncbi:hypothetical protein ACFL6X_00850 [Candidatus Latescibacterota bacterium]